MLLGLLEVKEEGKKEGKEGNKKEEKEKFTKREKNPHVQYGNIKENM